MVVRRDFRSTADHRHDAGRVCGRNKSPRRDRRAPLASRSKAFEGGRMRQTVTPYLLYEDASAAAAFLAEAFGFGEVERTTGAAGGVHIEMDVGRDGRVYLGS